MKVIRFCFASLLLPLVGITSAWADLRVHYEDDFILETTDQEYQLKIRGNLHLDTRLYQGEDCGSPAGIDIRRARYDLQGRLHGFLTFRVQPEFSGSPYTFGRGSR